MDINFDRNDYLQYSEIYESNALDDVTNELSELNDDIIDFAYELAYTRYFLAKEEVSSAALRARLAEVEAQRDGLKGTVRMLIGCVEDTISYPDMHDDFVEELEAAREALAKLEESK